MSGFGGIGRRGGGGGNIGSPIGALLDVDIRSDRLVRNTVAGAVTIAAGSTFTRATVADWLNSAGDNFATQAASGVLRRDSARGALPEPPQTNLFLNSFAPVTQTITVVNGTTYTVSRGFGAGSVTLSGALTGTVTAATPVTGVASGTSLTVTVVAPILFVNVVAAAFSTSPISTAGTSATRNGDVLTLNSPVPILTDCTLVFIGQMPSDIPVGQSRVAFRHGPTATTGIRLVCDSTNFIWGETSQVSASVARPAFGARFAIAGRYSGTARAVSLNGGTVNTATAAGSVAAQSVMAFGGNSTDDGLQWNSFVERTIVFPNAVNDATLQQYSTLATWGG